MSAGAQRVLEARGERVMDPLHAHRGLLVGGALVLLVMVACAEPRSELELAHEATDIGDSAGAIDHYQRYLVDHADDFAARLEYTLLLGERWAFKGGDRRPILDNFEILFAAQPGNPRIRELFAMMLVREGQAAAEARRYEDAQGWFERAIDVQPDVGTANYHLGMLYEEWGRQEAAFESYVAAALKRPRIPDLYLRLGLRYLERDDLDRAINTLELVDVLRGTSTYLLPRMHCGLAQAYERRGDREATKGHLEQASADCRVAG